ncbi:hypothetical protein BCR36DRAFT_580177 [Piromyces finnis]|uniref:Uncharacterized protein n=1 Tax=Piromyces finnis TaxID=1754191 RepID=A0A1Y1VKG0_9FUNG|nr:hypothetical protein BCR36DRAFT_580177 [Piromyces finnis]|eukprot:ORX58570.1 hypothetical protein BCR36DRAFT_580177 [Piromyces finnis]
MNNNFSNNSYNNSNNKSFNNTNNRNRNNTRNNNKNNKKSNTSNNKSYIKTYNRSFNSSESNVNNYKKNNDSFKKSNVNNDPLASWKKKSNGDNDNNKRWERVGYISRESINTKSEDLRQPEIQKQFYKYILEEIDKIDLIQIKEHTLDPVLASLRKLREGIVSAGQINEFNIEVFELSSRMSLKAKNFEELWKSLSYLITTLYKNYEYRNNTTQNDNRAEYIKYYLLYLICRIPPVNVNKSLIGNPQEVLTIYNSLSSYLKNKKEMTFIYNLITLFNIAPINYFRFSELYKKTSDNDKIIMQCRLPRIRQQTLSVLTKAYFTLPTKDIQEWLIINDYDSLKNYLLENWKQLPNASNENYEERITEEQVTLRVPKKRK